VTYQDLRKDEKSYPKTTQAD